MTLYVAYTSDDLELPVAVADTAAELAEMCGIHVSTVLSSISYEKKTGRKSKYKRIIIDDQKGDNDGH